MAYKSKYKKYEKTWQQAPQKLTITQKLNPVILKWKKPQRIQKNGYKNDQQSQCTARHNSSINLMKKFLNKNAQQTQRMERERGPK
jgi:hypothetical protein